MVALKIFYSLNTNNSVYLSPGKSVDKSLENIRRFWDKVKKEANVEDITIHDLRHTYASHLVSNGMSLNIVGSLLRHTQASTTQRYAHLSDEPLRQVTELFGNKMDEHRAREG